MGMNTATASMYTLIPMFTSTAGTPKVLAMSGSAVAITVASRFSMKNVTATNRAIIVERR
jgi:hypothetical protein